jgi:hypothetical protein
MNLAEKSLAWGIDHEGSTRAVGLLRIALALIILARYGREVAFFAADNVGYAMLGAYIFVLTPLMLVGLYARAATAMVAATLVCMYFLFGPLPDQTGWNHHHSYILMISVVFLAFTPCDRSYSLDRYFAVRRAEIAGEPAPAEYGQLWATRLIGLQMSALYFWTAVDKTNWAFLSGQRLEQIMVWHYSGRPLEELALWMPFLVLASVAVVAVEYFLVLAIHVRRLQRVAIPTAIALHAIFYVMLPVLTYSATMIALYLVVVNPEAVHRFMDRMQGHAPVAHRL